MNTKFSPPPSALVHDKFRFCHTSSENAAEFLKLAIDPLRNGVPVPDPLATFLADAIEIAMEKETQKEKIKTLSDELYLSANNTRAKGDWLVVGEDFEEQFEAEIVRRRRNGEKKKGAQTQIKKAIAKKYSISKSLAREHWIYWKKAMVEYRKILDEEDDV